jgi:hypothetical protein
VNSDHRLVLAETPPLDMALQKASFELLSLEELKHCHETELNTASKQGLHKEVVDGGERLRLVLKQEPSPSMGRCR